LFVFLPLLVATSLKIKVANEQVYPYPYDQTSVEDESTSIIQWLGYYDTMRLVG